MSYQLYLTLIIVNLNFIILFNLTFFRLILMIIF